MGRHGLHEYNYEKRQQKGFLCLNHFWLEDNSFIDNCIGALPTTLGTCENEHGKEM